MLLQGDINRIVEQINVITEGLSQRISVLEDELVVLKADKAPKSAKSTTKSTKVDTND